MATEYILIPKKLTWSLVAISLTGWLMGGAAIFWAGYVDQRSNHEWCPTVTEMDKAYEVAPSPPTSGPGLTLSREMDRLRKEWCDG